MSWFMAFSEEKNKNFPKSPLFLAPKRDKKGDALSPIYPFLLTLPLYFPLTQFLRASLSSLRFCIKQWNRLLLPYHPTRSEYLFPSTTSYPILFCHWNIMRHKSFGLLSDAQDKCVLYNKITALSLIVIRGKKSPSQNECIGVCRIFERKDQPDDIWTVRRPEVQVS